MSNRIYNYDFYDLGTEQTPHKQKGYKKDIFHNQKNKRYD